MSTPISTRYSSEASSQAICEYRRREAIEQMEEYFSNNPELLLDCDGWELRYCANQDCPWNSFRHPTLPWGQTERRLVRARKSDQPMSGTSSSRDRKLCRYAE